MASTFPDYSPIYPLSETTKPFLQGSRLGNGPQNRSVLGIQQFPTAESIQWKPLPVPDAYVIADFLEAHIRMNQWFYWTPPNGTTRKWRCKEFAVQDEGRGLLTIRAQFSETFEVTS
ncbi:MAG: hypothetical protein WCO50_00495 [Synechococcus sp. ELA619]